MRLTFADLEVCEEVGRGGFGVVYRGIVKQSLKEVAIKQIDLEDQPDLDEINNEIAIISECRHSNITRFLGCFVRNYRLWVIMEFVNGGCLHDLLKPGAMTNEGAMALVVHDLLLALEYLHDQGKIHRDLKSQNILVSKDGEIKLTDFGVSTQLSNNFSRRNTTVGTPYWMAPEVINNVEGHSFKADIWSLGCCAFEMVTGKPPLQSHLPPMKALRQISQCRDFIQLIEVNQLAISPLFRDFLHKCFAVSPERRWSASQLLKHKWISNRTSDRKLVKRLITNKQLWDQDHHVDRVHNFYVPTELADNQRKWQQPADAPKIEFDISSLELARDGGAWAPEEAAATSTIKQQSIVTSTLKQTTQDWSPIDSPQDLFQENDQVGIYKMPMHRVLTKVFHKLEQRCDLTTSQYDSLVKLNDTMLNLLVYSERKVVLFLYLKYFLKEISKPSNIQLQKSILPSHFKVGVTRQGTPDGDSRMVSGTMKSFNDIESSLFDSWVRRMHQAHTKDRPDN